MLVAALTPPEPEPDVAALVPPELSGEFEPPVPLLPPTELPPVFAVADPCSPNPELPLGVEPQAGVIPLTPPTTIIRTTKPELESPEQFIAYSSPINPCYGAVIRGYVVEL